MLKVIIIPKGEEDKPIPSSGIKKIVKTYLLKRCLNQMHGENLEIIDPSYKEIKVSVDIVPESTENAIPLEKQVVKELRKYFHPLTGGNEKNGWEFGRDVHISDVYRLLEGIEGVDHVKNLRINDGTAGVKLEEFETVCSGEHKITMNPGIKR